ncbi:MAG: hypothetical protein QXG39_07255 [Candidatus Aenigmatarchaeota archaeon]
MTSPSIAVSTANAYISKEDFTTISAEKLLKIQTNGLTLKLDY